MVAITRSDRKLLALAQAVIRSVEMIVQPDARNPAGRGCLLLALSGHRTHVPTNVRFWG
jgi:hypothetical protein